VAEAPVDVADEQPPVVDSDASEAAVTPESTPEATGSSATAAPPQQSQPLPLPETGDSAPVPVQAPAATAPSAATATPAPVAAPGEAQLELRFTADCWTRVTDADGRVLFSALAKAGTSRTVTGKAPLDVHLGYARGAQLSYNGEAVNLATHMRGETARLKLGQ